MPASTTASPTACSMSIRPRSAPRSTAPRRSCRDVVADDPALAGLLREAFADFPQALEPLAVDARRRAPGRAAVGAQRLRPAGTARASAPAHRAVGRARDFLIAEAPRTVASEELERVSGLDRFALGPPLPRRLRHLAAPLPGRPAAGRGAGADRCRRGAVGDGGGDGLRRPEPPHAPLLGALRPDAGPLGRAVAALRARRSPPGTGR